MDWRQKGKGGCQPAMYTFDRGEEREHGDESENETYTALADTQGLDAPFLAHRRFERLEPRIVEVA